MQPEIINPCQEYIAIKDHVEGAFLRMGELLKNIRDEKTYFPEYERFEDFLNSTGTSPATASKLIQIHERFILQYNIDPERLIQVRSWATLYEIQKKLPKDASQEEVDEWLDKGSLLKHSDIQKELQQYGKPPCEHTDTYTLRICRDCGERWRELEPDDIVGVWYP